MTYYAIKYPSDNDFMEMSNREGKRYFQWVMEHKQERIQQMLDYFHEQEVEVALEFDYTRESLITIWECYTKAISMGSFKQMNSLQHDLALYYGEVLIRNNEKLFWEYCSKEKYQESHRPIIGGFSPEMSPEIIVGVLTNKYLQGNNNKYLLYDNYNVWLSYLVQKQPKRKTNIHINPLNDSAEELIKEVKFKVMDVMYPTQEAKVSNVGIFFDDEGEASIDYIIINSYYNDEIIESVVSVYIDLKKKLVKWAQENPCGVGVINPTISYYDWEVSSDEAIAIAKNHCKDSQELEVVCIEGRNEAFQEEWVVMLKDDKGEEHLVSVNPYNFKPGK